MDMTQKTSLKVHFVGKSWKGAMLSRRGGQVQSVFEEIARVHQYSTGDVWGC